MMDNDASYVLCNSVPIRDPVSVGDGLLPSLCRFLIRLDVEVDEEAEVRGQETATKESSTLRAGAGAKHRELARDVCRHEVRIR